MITRAFRRAVEAVLRNQTQNFADSGNFTDTATPNTITDIAGATITFTPTQSSLIVILFSCEIQNNTATRRFLVDLFQDGSSILQVDHLPATSGQGQIITYIFFVDNVSAVSHTFKLRWTNTNAGDQLASSKGHLYALWWPT